MKLSIKGEMVTLSDICYEHIIDDYWYGLYGDFKLIIDKSTNLFNATKLCQSGGKNLSNWLRLKQTKELFAYCTDPSHVKDHLLHKIVGNKSEIYNKIISGTYVKQEFILYIAQWISFEFYFKVNSIILSHFANEFSQEYKNQKEQLVKRLVEVEEERVRLQARNNEIETKFAIAQARNMELISMNQEYQKIEEDVSPKSFTNLKRNIFLLIDKNTPNESYPYYAVRIQKGSIHKAMKLLRKKYPNLNILLTINYNPNSINLFNLAKEKLPNIKCKYNNIKVINSYTIENFICDFEKLSKFRIINKQ